MALALTSNGKPLPLDRSVQWECITLLNGDGSKNHFTAVEAADQIATLLDIEVELNNWTDVRVHMDATGEIAHLVKKKLVAIGLWVCSPSVVAA